VDHKLANRGRCSGQPQRQPQSLLVFALIDALQKLLDASAVLQRVADVKDKFRGALQSKSLGDLVTNVALRGSKRLAGVAGLPLVALNVNKDMNRLSGGTHVGHGDRSDARIGKLTLQDGRDLQLQSFADAFLVMALAAVHEKSFQL
jgi:hypothetical protein